MPVKHSTVMKDAGENSDSADNVSNSQDVDTGNEDRVSKEELCKLMIRLKRRDPKLGRKEIHVAVQGQGDRFKDVTFDDVKRTWKKVLKSIVEEEGDLKTMDMAANSENKRDRVAEIRDAKDINKREAFLREWRYAAYGNTSVQSTETVEPNENEEEIEEIMTDSSRSPALAKQLKVLEEYPGATYVLFTPSNEASDQMIQLSNFMGALFFKMTWNRVIEVPFGSITMQREICLIYQQLQGSLLPKYRKLLRNQLIAEFGVDPLSDEKIEEIN